MKKLILLSILFIVGCDTTEPKDEIQEVAWIYFESFPNQFGNTTIGVDYTEGFEPDTFWNTNSWENYDACIEYNNSLTEQYAPFNCVGHFGYIFLNDTINSIPKLARNIIHFIEPNYFEIIEETPQSSLKFPEDYEIFKYEYK